MGGEPARRRRTRIPAAFRRSPVVLAVIAFLLLAPVSAASAHDVLIDTNPGEGQVLAMMPGAIELTFNNVPLAIGTEIVVQDTNGNNWADGEVDILDNTVRQRVSPGAPHGRYAVVWRVVSSDGHPIDGTFALSVSTGGAGVPPATQGKTQATGNPRDVQGTPESGKFPTNAVLGTLAALPVLAGAVMMVRRRRSGRNGSA